MESSNNSYQSNAPQAQNNLGDLKPTKDTVNLNKPDFSDYVDKINEFLGPSWALNQEIVA